MNQNLTLNETEGRRRERTHGTSITIIVSFIFLAVVVGSVVVNQWEFSNITKTAVGHAKAGFTDEIKRTLLPNASFSTKTTNSIASNQKPQKLQRNHPAFRLLIGIFTLPDKYRHRNLLRWVYGIQTPKISQMDVKFVFCNLTTEEQQVIIALEIMRYDDIIILDCKENMNNGKTYTYFSSMNDLFESAPGNRPAPYDYIMKADDDTFVLLPPLEESLKDLAREDMYYGLVTPCQNTETTPDHYMSGMGYILSWDLAEHIRNSSYAKSHRKGPEDLVLGTWLKEGQVAKNRYNVKPRFYDLPGSHACEHDFTPDSIAIHRLKEQDHWIRAVNYFDMTKELKPSKLYHLV